MISSNNKLNSLLYNNVDNKNITTNLDYSLDDSVDDPLNQSFDEEVEEVEELSYYLTLSTTLNSFQEPENKMDCDIENENDENNNKNQEYAKNSENVIPFETFQNVAGYLYEQSENLLIHVTHPRIIYIDNKRYIENKPYSLKFYCDNRSEWCDP